MTGTCGGSLVGDTFTTAAVTADCSGDRELRDQHYTLTYTAGRQRLDHGHDAADGELRRRRHARSRRCPTPATTSSSWSDGVLTASAHRHQRDRRHHRHRQLRDQPLHPDLHRRGQRLDHGHHAADGEPRRRRHARSRRSPTPATTSSSWSDGVLTASAHRHERHGQHQRHGELRDQHLHPDLHGGRQRHDHAARRRRR